MSAPKEVLDLIERFERNLDSYKNGKYNETQLRREFLDPFFEALGWDVNNRQGWAEAYKEVIHEDAVKVGGATKAPDYSFRIGGARKFFVEAKKPSVNIKEDFAPAFQLRRYAWSAKLPLSIVTDFEEFAVYDCRNKPDKSDKSSNGRTVYLTFRQYAERWDEIAGIFSKEAVLKGSFDKYAASHKAKRGTAEVDDAFLHEIESWRDLLAKNIALRNPALSGRELNYAVQVTIDRLIFLRICEDRGIEPYGKLQALLNGANIHGRLKELYHQADQRYNSGLFHFRPEKGIAEAPDELTPGLVIDDKVLKEILRHFYYPDSPYEFSVLPADILGQVYEQFLGKVIRLTANHRAVVEDKPEVRKAGGVFYTPTYIVDYIVKNTVGRQLEGRTPKEAEKFRIIDPACGSGSFLLGAYQYLLDWHLKWYVSNGPEKQAKAKKPVLYQTHSGEWRLTTAERKRILLNNIYGVDIDAQAVEVTKLSLLLKVLEGETEQSLNSQMSLFHERALPNLGSNIKCGNSLIGPDFYEGDQLGLLGNDEECYRINAFDWKSEFAEIFEAGGFDAVIGNPPYLNIDKVWGKGDVRLQAIKRMYPKIYNDKTDILFYFLAKASEISKKHVSFIISRSFLEAYKANKLRDWLVKNVVIEQLVDFQNFYVFEGVGITTCIITLLKNKEPIIFPAYKLKNGMSTTGCLDSDLDDRNLFERTEANQINLSAAPWVFVSDSVSNLNAKIDSAGVAIEKILVIGQGMQTGKNDVFGKRCLDEINDFGIKKGLYFRRASNSDIQRYFIRDRGEYLIYLEDVNDFPDVPVGVQKYLKKHELLLKNRAAFKRGNCNWWRYTWPLHKVLYSRSKILCPYLAKSNRFALDVELSYIGLTDTTVLFDNGQPENLFYLLGLLNSRLLTYRYRSIGKLRSDGIYEYFWNSISKLSIRRINFSKSDDQLRHDRMVEMVKLMISLHNQHKAANTSQEKNLIQRQIDALDKQIDRLVYELYDLTEEEIALVEADS